MKSIISCFTLGLTALPVLAQQFGPTVQPGIRPGVQPAPTMGIMPYPNQNQRPSNYSRPRQYPNNPQTGYYGNRQYNNGYSVNGQYNNYGNRQNNGNYGQNNRQNYGQNNRNTAQYGRNPNVTGQPSWGAVTTPGVAAVIPWWYTGRFNTALPHIRQQRPMPQMQNNNSGYGNRFPQPQYNNIRRPQNNFPQQPNYNNGYNRGQQQYRPTPYNGYGPSVQPRVLR